MTEKNLRDTLLLYFGADYFLLFSFKKKFLVRKKLPRNGVNNLRSLFQKLLFLIVPILMFLSQSVSAMDKILPLNQVKSGMSGVGYTVVENTGQIEPFNVDIVGVTQGGKGTNSMIMARASGELIDRTGGVLQGMSGSPIYVDGKLVGALAIGLKEMSPYTFFITPIETMMKIWELPDKRADDRIAQWTPKKIPEENSAEEKSSDENKSDEDENNSDENNSSEENNLNEDDSTEEKAIIFFSGFDDNSLNFLQNELSPLGFKNFYAAPALGSRTIVKHHATLVPGDAVGVAVVYGDFTVGATGTVTAVDSEKILAFGHSFAHTGNVNYFMTDSAVLGPISGMNGNGMRIASVGNIIGRVNQDRDAGISGIIGKFPTVLPITVHVKNNALNTSETYSASIAYNENLIPKLGASIVYAALSKSTDSLEESTVNINFDIKTNVTEDGIISRHNMFYHDTDAGQVAITELLQALNLICSNVTAESDIYDIEVYAEINGGRKIASVVSAVPNKKIYKPGDTIRFEVTLQPYRKSTEKITIPYTLPLTAREGNLTLDIRGASLVPVAQQTAPANVVVPSTEPPEKEYEKRIRNFINMGYNNQIIIEPSANQVPRTDKERKAEIKRLKKLQERLAKMGDKKSAPQTQKVDSDYIIDNVIQVNVNVGKI